MATVSNLIHDEHNNWTLVAIGCCRESICSHRISIHGSMDRGIPTVVYYVLLCRGNPSLALTLMPWREGGAGGGAVGITGCLALHPSVLIAPCCLPKGVLVAGDLIQVMARLSYGHSGAQGVSNRPCNTVLPLVHHGLTKIPMV